MSEQLQGEVTTFLDAIGTPGGLFRVPKILALVGPTYESVDTQKPGSEQVVFPQTGTHLFFKNEVLIGALIYVVENEGHPPYPTPTKLVPGIEPGASREQVRAVMGEPRQGSQFMDLFMVDDKYVRFDYDGDSWASLSLLLPGQDSL